VTTPAAVPQSAIERAIRAAMRSGAEAARISIDLPARRIDIFLGKAAADPAALPPEELD